MTANPSNDQSNAYHFDRFLEWRQNFDYYGDDPFIQKVVKHFAGADWNMADRAAREISPKVSFRWRDMTEVIARPENQPFVQHYDAHHHRIDRIVRPAESGIMEREVFSEALFADNTPPWIRLIKMYLIYQNGEACISCPLTCTEGLVALLEGFADTEATKSILNHCKDGVDGDYAIGAQYLSEIQGGSDVTANVLEAVRDDAHWRLYGSKFFCSATHADYAVVTAKPEGSSDIGLFVVPSWLPGNKTREIRNGYTIDRIKRKLGTCELTTAEITYNGAVAYPVGPLDRGIFNVVNSVLTCSRLTVGLSAAASMTRATREARRYSEFRHAFGRKIGDFPMLAGQLAAIEATARRTTAGAFKLYSDYLQLRDGYDPKNQATEMSTDKRKSFMVRELIMLQKLAASWDAVDVIRSAISVFGGHGAMEDFSALPRLLRDAMINELWEGPRNVLLSQIHRDCQRSSRWFSPQDFIAAALAGSDTNTLKGMGDEMTELVNHPSLTEMDHKTLSVCRKWDDFCHRFFHAYQDLALAAVD